MGNCRLLKNFLKNRVEIFRQRINHNSVLRDKLQCKIDKKIYVVSLVDLKRMKDFNVTLKNLNCLWYSWQSIYYFYSRAKGEPVDCIANMSLKSFCDLEKNITSIINWSVRNDYSKPITALEHYDKVAPYPDGLVLPCGVGVPTSIKEFLASEVKNLYVWNGNIYKDVIKKC
jgi:hypothetical protein